MYFLDTTSLDGATSPPTRPAPGERRFFRDENPPLGLEGTEVPAWVLNMIVNEMVNAVQAAGVTLDKSNDGQLADAISRLSKPRAQVRVTATNMVLAAVANAGNLIRCSAAVTVSLPAAATAADGWMCRVQHAGASGWVTIDPDGSETINDLTTLALAPGEHALIVCTGSAWYALVDVGSIPHLMTVASGATEAVWSMPDARAAATHQVWISAYDLQLSGSNVVLVQLGSGSDASPAWVTTGYTSVTISQTYATGDEGGGTIVDTPSNGVMLGGTSASQKLQVPQLLLTRVGSTTWQIGAVSLRAASLSYTCHGTVSVPGFNRFRLIAAATNTFVDGHITTRLVR